MLPHSIRPWIDSRKNQGGLEFNRVYDTSWPQKEADDPRMLEAYLFLV